MKSARIHDGVMTTTFSQAVRKAISAELAYRHMSQRELARELGWGQRFTWLRLSLSNKATGDLTLTELEAIARILKMPIMTLCGGAKQRYTHPRTKENGS